MNDMNMQKRLITKIYLYWVLNPNEKIIEDDNDPRIDDMFLTKIVLSKLKLMNLPIKISLYGALLIEVCAQSNPGLGQIIYSEIMNTIRPITPGYIITAEDFVRRFDNYFPDITDENAYNELLKLWDKQKTETGSNSVDRYEYWKNYFNVEEIIS